MPEAGHALARRAALELVAWYSAAALFLAAYVVQFGNDPASIRPHLRLLTEAVVGLAALRVAASAVFPRAGQAVSTLVALAAFAALVFYYLIEVMMLRSWGRLITGDLIVSHGSGALLMFEAMGLPRWVVAAAALIAAALLAWLGWQHARRLDWVGPLASLTRRMPRAVVALLLLAVVGLDLHEYLRTPPLEEREPVSLAFLTERTPTRMQIHGLDRAAASRRDQEEQAARAAYQPSPSASRRNVILIVGDALRADHLGFYGYARDTTPNLAGLRAAGMLRVAPPVRTVCSETLCALPGLLASRYVHRFSERMFMLSEVLKRHGYRTAMILGGDHTHFYGLREVYGPVDSYVDGASAGERYINDDQVVVEHVNRLPEWDGRPVMMRFHLMSSHMLGKRREANVRYTPEGNYFFVTNQVPGDDGKTYEKAVNYYDNGVREFDAVVASLLEALKRKRYLDDAVVAVTGDHGDSLGEHGLWGHGNGLTEEVLRVPFLLLNYGYKPQSELDPLAWPSQVDIAPTILAELGMPIPATWSGVALQRGPVRRDFVFLEQGARLGLVDTREGRGRWKYWEDLREGTAAAFDLERDPREMRNALAEAPAARVEEWRRALAPVKAQYVAGQWKRN